MSWAAYPASGLSPLQQQSSDNRETTTTTWPSNSSRAHPTIYSPTPLEESETEGASNLLNSVAMKQSRAAECSASDTFLHASLHDVCLSPSPRRHHQIGHDLQRKKESEEASRVEGVRCDRVAATWSEMKKNQHAKRIETTEYPRETAPTQTMYLERGKNERIAGGVTHLSPGRLLNSTFPYDSLACSEAAHRGMAASLRERPSALKTRGFGWAVTHFPSASRSDAVAEPKPRGEQQAIR
ncbi:hypothetical protein MUK42_30450 [Musa troglodytarum]|uniref:Uncharacterized protein n=1 Tax=Musa troglodytarum TaxID=320322 RepID=A0A9E7JZX4_9LILI|nr:hypothetical protein MUK42_30450 [Musa troglodytarum]